MARQARTNEVEAILRQAVDAIVGRTADAIGKAVAARVAAELRGGAKGRGGRPRVAARRRRPPQGEITKWVADRRARRVPNFVIEATGLDTKKKIVAKYGANVVFEKGKDLPQPGGARAKGAPGRKGATSAK